MKLRISRWAAALFAASGLLFSSCAQAQGPRTEHVLGTLCTVNLFERGSEDAYREIFARLREIENRMSANKDGTDVAAVNAGAGVAPAPVHRDVMEVVVRALEFAELSSGAFDPTVGPLVALWGIGSEAARVPSPEEIASLLPLVNYRDVAVDRAAGTVFLKRPGMRLDLGAIAKGYAADEVARIIRRRGIPRAMIDLGGNVLAYGVKQGNQSWRIGVQDPSGLRGSYMGILQVRNKTMVTSGVYERFLDADGVRYHHILSTADGYPVRSGLLSVTIVADASMDADALSTAAFALGYEKGLPLLESLPGVEAIFVSEDLSVRATTGVKKDFEITDPRYTLVD